MVKTYKEGYNLQNDPYYKMSQFDINNYKIEFWDVNETISELSYLTHSYFRYYGKFPSKIGKMILDDLDNRDAISPSKDIVLDNYAGSGTTLVEAKLKGYESYGIDINPFAVLSSKVKTRNYNVKFLRQYWFELENEINAYEQELGLLDEIHLQWTTVNKEMKGKILDEVDQFLMYNKDGLKWFSESTIKEIATIKVLLLKRPHSEEREFFELAFFAIIRRVSFAYDGEVRPHVNKKKRVRNVLLAYSKKVSEMIDLMQEWNDQTDASVCSDAILCNNADGRSVNEFVSSICKKKDKNLGLVVSHPPYLNCFDYIPVYKLEFMWSSGFDDIFYGYNMNQIKKMEIKSYPANSKNIESYFQHNKNVYQIVFTNLRKGGYCCVVIGDCTVNNQLFAVHKTFIAMLEQIGFKTEKIAYRSTAYGIGQYAYRFRADYNEDINKKRDGVIFFRKP